MFGLELIGKIIKILRSNESPNQIAAGFILGMILGITPFLSLINILIIFVIIIVSVNISSAILAYAVFTAVVYLGDPLFNSLGYWLLVNVSFLKPIWIFFYHAPIIPYTSYNNTVYLGSLVVAILLLWPVLKGVKAFVINYREKYDKRVQNWKWIKALKASKVYSLYNRLKFLGD
jgi:uncharacterized protein (TIGR03546 family)